MNSDLPTPAAQPIARGGVLLVSLDFELYWGMRDQVALASYRENLLGVRRAVPRLLELFGRYRIHATWAAVGFLFFDRKDELLSALPARRPGYLDATLSPYVHLDAIGPNEDADPCHFASSLLRLVTNAPGQEIATHTMSHYYCLEPGQSVEDFKSDLDAAIAAGRRFGRRITSIVFPRNQVNEAYLAACKEAGLVAYRGTERSFFLRADDDHAMRSPLRRALRLLDAYVDLSGPNVYPLPAPGGLPVNLPASRFLRPVSRRLGRFEGARLDRIRDAMTTAARTDRVFHLWWHPHNFGVDTDENLAFLEEILRHYAHLAERHGMKSLTMSEAAQAAVGESRDAA